MKIFFNEIYTYNDKTRTKSYISEDQVRIFRDIFTTVVLPLAHVETILVKKK